MKKISLLMMAMAISALTFTACEDVPEPYPTPTPTNNGGNNGQGEGTATGDGTLENPFNSVAAARAARELGSGNVSEQMYYIKGKVVSIATDKNGNVLNFDQGTYGNASFYISDDGTSTNQFYCYRVLYLGNKKWTAGAGDILKEGDEVIVCAKLTMYNTTPETQQNEGFLYSLNGKSEGGSGENGVATGDGSLANPFNAVAATNEAKKLASGAVSDKAYYIKGKVASIATDKNGNVLNFDQGTYGNASFYISDDGTASNQFYCYRVLYLGNKKWTSGAGDILKEGDEVIVCAKLTLYNTTPETQQNEGYLYSLNGKSEGGGGDISQGEAKGDGSLNNPFNAVAATNEAKKLASGAVSDKAYYIKGKVASIATDKNGNAQNFDYQTYGNASFYISDDGTASNQFYCYRVLYLGNKKWEQGAGDVLKVGDEVIVCAKLTMYNSTPETQQNEGYLYSLNGKTESSGSTPTPQPGGEVKTVTVADFNAAAESNDVWYQLTGTVKNLKDNDQYGNFDLEDATGSVYVYGLLSEKGGEKKKFQDLVAAKGIKNGCTLTIIGTRGSYNDKIEVMNAYFVSIEGGDTPGGGGGGDTPGGGGEVSGASISIAAADFGFEDKGAATQKTLSDGTKIVFDKGEGSTAPAYYGGSYASVRIYAKNTVTITASKKIVKIEIETTDPSGSNKYNGNDMAYADGGSKVSIKKESDTKVSFSNLSASTVKIVNDHSEAKGGTQLRIKTLTITYAE